MHLRREHTALGAVQRVCNFTISAAKFGYLSALFLESLDVLSGQAAELG